MSEAKPFPKSAQLARGERRYRRQVASPKQWQAIIAAKRGPCRVCSRGYGPIEFHHLFARIAGGDDVAENIVPLHAACHERVTRGEAEARAILGEGRADRRRARLHRRQTRGGRDGTAIRGGAAVNAVHVACDRCTQGVMDATNPHLLGTCRCKCHLVGGVIDPAVLAERRLTLEELEARVDEWVRNG